MFSLGSLLGIVLSVLLVHFSQAGTQALISRSTSAHPKVVAMKPFRFVLRGVDAAQRAESIEPLFDTLGT